MQAATDENVTTLGAQLAGADLSTKQHCFANVDSTGIILAGAGTRVVGIVRNKPIAGQAVTLGIAGKQKVITGSGGITLGARVKSDASGHAVAAADADAVIGAVCGWCAMAASATEMCEVVLVGPNTTAVPNGIQSISVTGTAIDVTKRLVKVTIDGTMASALGSGLFDGQLLTIQGLTGTNTPAYTVTGAFLTNVTATTTALFNAASDKLDLMWDATAAKWFVLTNVSVTLS